MASVGARPVLHGMALRMLVFSLLCIWQARGQLCLPNGIPAASRSDLISSNGSYPVGLVALNLTDSIILKNVAEIVIQEVLGFNTVEPFGTLPTMHAAMNAMFGCTSPASISAYDFILEPEGCGTSNVTHSHVSLDIWEDEAYWHTLMASAAAFLEPERLGSIGFAGVSGMFVSGAVLQAAVDAQAAPLDSYLGLGYDQQPWTHFDSVSSFNTSTLMPCALSLAFTSLREAYTRNTGLSDLSCPDGHFWLAPACRGNSAECIPAVAWSPWSMFEFMQKAAVWDIALAVAAASSWTTFASLPHEKRCLFYMWAPGETFLTLAPRQVMFPQDDAKYAAGNQSFHPPPSLVLKYVSHDLSKLAPSVYCFLEQLQINKTSVDSMLLDWLQTGDLHRDVACRWLLANQGTWSDYVPSSTTTVPGFGPEVCLPTTTSITPQTQSTTTSIDPRTQSSTTTQSTTTQSTTPQSTTPQSTTPQSTTTPAPDTDSDGLSSAPAAWVAMSVLLSLI